MEYKLASFLTFYFEQATFSLEEIRLNSIKLKVQKEFSMKCLVNRDYRKAFENI